jgi:hypothetical protein
VKPTLFHEFNAQNTKLKTQNIVLPNLKLSSNPDYLFLFAGLNPPPLKKENGGSNRNEMAGQESIIFAALIGRQQS